MKKLTTFALIILALFSGVLFSACGDKYKNLDIDVVYTDGTEVEELVLILDEADKEKATKRIGVKFSGIKEKDIGQVAVYSSPSELFTTSNEKYSGNYFYVDITASKAAPGELVVKHLSTDKTEKVKLRIEQKANDLSKRSEKYIVAVNGVEEGKTREHILQTKNLVALSPSTSTDKVYFKEAGGTHVPAGVEKLTQTIDGVAYVTGFKISSNAVEQASGYKLIPVTKMEGYEDKSYDDVLHNDYEVVEIFFKKVLTNDNVKLGTDEKHIDDEGKIYETIHLIANDTSADKSNRYNYNNVLFSLETVGLGEISKFLDDYNISVVENSSAIQSTHTGNGVFVVQASASTDNSVEVEFKLTPKNIVGDVEEITKKVFVKGEVRSDTITAKKGGEDVNINEIVDIYNYVAGGNDNGLKFNFKAISKSGIAVYSDLALMRIEISPEILYLNVKDGVYTNIKDENGDVINSTINEIDGIDLISGENLIRIFKGNSYLNFQYDEDKELFISEPFMSFSDLYIKYVENTNPDTDNVPLELNVTAGYEGELKYLKDIIKTSVTLNFEATEGVYDLKLFAAERNKLGGGGYDYPLVKDDSTGEPIVAENIYINKDDVTEQHGYALTILKDKSIIAFDGSYINEDVKFDVTISHSSKYTNPISLNDVNQILEIDVLEKNIQILIDANTTVGHYTITFEQGNGFSKSINVYIFKAINNEHLTLKFADGELDNDTFKNSYYDGDDKKFIFADYEADYIVHSGKTLNLTAVVDQGVVDSNIIKTYSHIPSVIKETDAEDIVLNTYFNHLPNETDVKKSQLNFTKGTVVGGAKYYISYNVVVETKEYKNILQEDEENSRSATQTITFFIYDRVVEDKLVKATLAHPNYDLYMYDNLGGMNKQYGQADLQIIMDNDNLWNYVQKQEQEEGGEKYFVKWLSNYGSINFLNNQTDDSIAARFASENKPYYTGSISAQIKQFNRIIELTWDVIVNRPILTEELRLTSAQPKFSKITNKAIYGNSIFEYNLDLREGDKFTVTADQISKSGNISHEGITLVVSDYYGYKSDAVIVDGNTITVDRVQDGLRLIVYATDVLNDDVSKYSVGFKNPEVYIKDGVSPYQNMYKNAYLIINLHLENGESRETAYSIYDLNDFKEMLNSEQEYKYYRIMNDINLTGLDVFNKDFKGYIFTENNENCTLYDLKLTAENKNLFKTFDGQMENITFETEYAYDSTTTTENLGVIGELVKEATLKYVGVIASGESSLEITNRLYNFGLIVGVNNGKIHYYENINETTSKFEGKQLTAASGRITIKGKSAIVFGGIAGVNNGEIIGVNYNESDLTGGASQNITFATSTEQQGAMVNIDLIADGLISHANSAIGGIVGKNCGKLTNAYVTGEINAPNIDNVGGAIGYAETTANIEYEIDKDTKQVKTSADEVANVEHVKSNVVIIAKDYVGGIVGRDTYGVYKHCWYQILPTTSVGISANQYVGGIVGYSSYSKLQFCSVFSYKYDYASETSYIASLKNQDGTDKDPDIRANNYVAGLIGYAVHANIEDTGVDIDVTSSIIVRNCSVDAIVASNDQIGAIYTTRAKTKPIGGYIYSSYFIGKLNTDKILNYEQNSSIDGKLCLDNIASSYNNEVYTLNFDGTNFVSGKTVNFDIDSAAKYWNLYTDVNLDYIYVTSDENLNKPIFDLVPSSFDVQVKSDNSKTLNTYYYDFSISGASEDELKLLNEEFNQYNLVDLFAFTYAPGGNIAVAVSSSDTNIIDIVVGEDGKTKLRIVGLGETTLRFNPVLNPNLVCEIVVKVADNLTRVVVAEDGENPVSRTINIAKDKTKQLHTYSVGEVTSTKNGNRKFTYKATIQYGLMLNIEWHDDAINSDFYINDSVISDYINVNGATFIKEIDETLKVYVPYGTPLSFTSKMIGGKFKIQAIPHVNEDVEYIDSTSNEFVVSTWQGVTGISLNYNSAIVYPNDVTTLVAIVETDIPLKDDEIWELLNSAYLIQQGKETNIDLSILKSDYLSLKDNGFAKFSNNQQIVEFLVKIDNKFENEETVSELKINFKTDYTSFETVEYTILPQRIDKIEAKSYIYTDFAAGKIEQSEVLKPNNLGLLVVDIAPINGYFDYLEIDDVTGNEEIKFVQVDGIFGESLFDVDYPSSTEKGIRLVKVDKNNDGIIDSTSIYVTMQIDKNYTSKMHTLKISAYYQENGVGTVIKTDYKYIDVKMLPIIKVEHQLPNGEVINHETEASVTTIENKNDLYFANGTSNQFRILTFNTTEPLEYKDVKTSEGVNGKFELVNTHGDFYVLRNTTINENDCGGVITITLTAKSIIANVSETTTMILKFKIVKYVIHSVSVTNSNAKNEIYGNTGVKTSIEFYFKETDISYLENGTYHDKAYTYEEMEEIDPSDTANVVTRKSINNILRELNADATTNEYLILNSGKKDGYTRSESSTENEVGKYNPVIDDVDNTQDDIKKTYDPDLKSNILMVRSGYNRESYLAVDMELVLDSEKNWKVQPNISSGSIDLSRNYKLNFNKPYSEEDYMLVKNVDDFLAMESGKQNYYILGNDLVLKNYAPIDIDIAEFDGNGRTITIESFAEFKEASINAGLFKQIYKGMVVKNVNIVYKSTREETVYSFGKVRTNGNISNVKDFDVEYADLCNDYTVNYTSAAFGGLTAVNNGVVTNCTVNGEIALRASTVEINKTSTTNGNYAINFNIGGLVGTNSSSGYITNSTSGLKIFALANVGGLVYSNEGKISSSSVEDEALIYSYNINLEKTILVEVGGFVSKNSGQISMSHTTLNYLYTQGDTTLNRPEKYKGFMSSKDESAGFVHTNSGDIKNCYVQISNIGDNNNVYCGFVYSNTGNIANSYTSLNGGYDAGVSTYMFAQDGTNNLIDCVEFVSTESNGYVKDSSIGLKTLDYEQISGNADGIQKEFESYNFIFGNTNQAVWTMENSELPKLVACEDKVRYTAKQESNGNKYYGLRNFEYVEKSIKNDDGSTSFEMKVEFVDDTYGNKENPFIIASLANWENRFYNNSSAYYRIVSDIEFSSNANPKSSEMVFSGNIQGNDMILSNIKLYLQDEVDALGLFKTLQTADNIRIQNSVRNLTLKTTTAWASKADAIGLLSGKAIGFGLYNITVDSSNVVLVGGNAVGGVVGFVGGNLDIDGISSNIGVNSTRELSAYRYNIYEGVNNWVESNLTSVFYAGSAFGILDGYNRSPYDINDPRNLEDPYYYANHISISGSPVLIGDSVGAAIGFVGERTYVKNVNINLVGAEFKGYQYSAGLAGENRGVIENAKVVIAGESFAETNYAAAGVVGLNIGGLVKDVHAQVDIVKNSNISVGGIVARNINGTLNNVSFDGAVFGQIVGGIMASNYTQNAFKLNSGAGSISIADNLDLVIPSDSVVYKANGNKIELENLTISEKTLQYFIDNISKFYIYEERTRKVGDADEKYLVQEKFKAFGLFAGMTDLDDYDVINNVYFDESDVNNKLIVLNGYVFRDDDKDGIDERIDLSSTEDKNVGFDYDATIGFVTSGSSYYLKSDGSLELTNNNEMVRTIKIKTDYLYTIYITGAKVGTFDGWDKTNYTNDFIVFGKFGS